MFMSPPHTIAAGFEEEEAAEEAEGNRSKSRPIVSPKTFASASEGASDPEG